jgi:hypothetical protein
MSRKLLRFLFLLIVTCALQLPTSMLMARRLMDGVCWWMLREHALSRAGFQGDLVS